MKRDAILIQLICSLFLVVGLSSCKIYQSVKVKRIVEFDLSELTNNQVSAVLSIELENPNPYKIALYACDLDLKIDGNNAGSLSLADPVVLSPKSTQVYNVNVFTDMKDVEGFLGNALSLMFKDEIEFEASGFVQAKAILIKKSVPFSFSKPLSRKAFKLN